MVCSLAQDELFDYVRNQAKHFFPDKYSLDGQDVKCAFHMALERLEKCFEPISIHGYHDAEGNTVFSHLHGDQYATFLYFFGNSLWRRSQNVPLCDKLLQLNRVMYSLFISYKCQMPDIFFLDHPIGTVLGNASYGNYLVVLHGVTVNTHSDVMDRPLSDSQGRALPILGKGVFLSAGSMVLGGLPVGDRVSVAANTVIHEREIPDDSIVTPRAEGGIQICPRKKSVCKAQECFNVPI